MRLPALRAKIGEREFYVTALSFRQVVEHVESIDDNLYVSKTLSDLLQRSITSNKEGIAQYILNQPELFFNSLVLAVYDNYPEWHQIVVRTDNTEYFDIGLLEFPGPHKIFPIDGQHRVEGIKEALRRNPGLAEHQIGAIFIGHEHTLEGRKKTRRIFTTLNRYAKPVSLRDSIALDEDDIVAIITRDLLEENDLFKGNRIVDALGKAIANNNVTAFTSIITLYQCTLEVYKEFRRTKDGKVPNKGGLEKLLKFRRDTTEIDEFKAYAASFWNAMASEIDALKTFLAAEENPAMPFRNVENGGHMLFRPAGLLPYVNAALRLKGETESYQDLFKRLNGLPYSLNAVPWLSVLWNGLEKKMITSSSRLVYLMTLWLADEGQLSSKEMKMLRESYASKLGIEEDVDTALAGIKGST